jgi:hypothetical protein
MTGAPQESCLCFGHSFAGSCASNSGDWLDEHRTSSHRPIQARLHEAIENDRDNVLSKLLHIQLYLPDLRSAPGKRVTKARVEDL